MRTTFLGGQFRYLFQSLPQRTRLWHKFYFFYELARLPGKSLRLRRALRRPGPAIDTGGRTCAVVLLSHNRPQNLDLLVRGALQNRFVTKVIVSNSNPQFRIADWIAARDPRLVLIDETQKTLPGHRFVIAERQAADYFLSIDDDIFLRPDQWAAFFQRLLQHEAVPHGLSGQVFRPGIRSSNGSCFHHLECVDAEVDVLIGAYAFTRAHLRRVFALAAALGIDNLTNVGNGEDIMLSFAGNGPARIHDLDHPLLCASTSLPGVALWKTRAVFWDERTRLFERIKEVRLALEIQDNLAGGRTPAASLSTVVT